MLQFLAPYTISSFAKIPTLHERRNQNHAHGFSHTPSADTMPNTFSTSDSFFGRPSKVNTTDFELRLGSYKINPFKSGKLDGSQLYAAHVRIFHCRVETVRQSSNPIYLPVLHPHPILPICLIILLH